ncbi:MAG: divergent PAP2 family protein [Bacteroidales bacterium]|nr:divergent PAP2 family protein [Candidatus Latescibacterota bacterium]
MIKQLFYRDIFLLPVICAILVQLLKGILYSLINRKFDIARFFQADGMPNLHASVFGSVAALIGIKYGYSSILFSVTTTYCLVIIHDMMRLKRQKEKQADVLNEIITNIKEYKSLRSAKITRVLQFRPLDVMVGTALGVLLTYGLL